MRIKVFVSTCFDYTKLTAVITCLIWLFFVTRYLELKPEYASLDYIKKLHQTNKNNGIIRMSAVTNFKKTSMYSSEIKKGFEDFYSFGLFELSQPKNKIICEDKLNLLVINANYREVGDSYLSLYKELEKINPNCKTNIFELCRRDHLLMDTDLMLSHYAMQVALSIQILVREQKLENLMIFTFEEGGAILIKSFQFLRYDTLRKLGTLVFLNAYNFNIKIRLEPPYRYIHNIQNNLLQDKRKMQILNRTQLIFISTTNYYDQSLHDPEDQRKFAFLWSNNTKMQKTLILNTRFMRNFHILMHERDYFVYGNLPLKLSKFFHSAPYNFQNLSVIEYFFKFGELNGRLQPDLRNLKYKLCSKSGLDLMTVNKFTKILSGPCVVVDLGDKMKEAEMKNHTALFVASKRSQMFNSRYQKVEPMFETLEQSYYMFDKLLKSNQMTLVNINKSQPVYIQFHKPYGPHSNPLPKQFFKRIGMNTLLERQTKIQGEQRKLIKVCPGQQALIFPDQFSNVYSGNNLILVLIMVNLNKIVIDFNNVYENAQEDCYPDFTTQLFIIPQAVILDWHRHHNMIILILLLSYVRREAIFRSIQLYFTFTCFFYYLGYHQFRLVFCFTMVCVCVFVQKSLGLTVHLVGFIQEMVDIKYRKLMLLLTLTLATIKFIFPMIQEIDRLSAWKLFLISLIFLVNRNNIIVLVIKLYYLSDHILYNHNDCFQLLVVLTWVYASLYYQDQSEQEQQSQFLKKLQSKKQVQTSTLKWPRSGVLQTLLISFLCVFNSGPTIAYNIILTLYMVLKGVVQVWSKNKIQSVV